jgi:hypothetical protein
MIRLGIKKLARFEQIGQSHHRRSQGSEQPTRTRRRARLGVRPRLAYGAFKRIVAGFSPGEQSALFFDTAKGVYRP